jgi:hypothetical protein
VREPVKLFRGSEGRTKAMSNEGKAVYEGDSEYIPLSDVEMNSTALTIAIQRELSEYADIFKDDRSDPRLRTIQSRINYLALARMNLKSA